MRDLLVIGAGHLGTRVATLWKDKFPDAKVFLKTKTENLERSEKWRSLGYQSLASTDPISSIPKCSYVVYSVPPIADDAQTSYAADVEASVDNYLNPDGVFVFTSSGGVYTENSGKIIDEKSPVVTSEGRSKIILDAESKVLKVKNGFALRFGGLYTSHRGAHSFWLKSGRPEFPSAPNGLINLVHYQDAAEAVLAVLLKPDKSTFADRLFLISDGSPISRKEICSAALSHPDYKEFSAPKFTGDESLIDGKKYDVTLFKSVFNWSPVFESFEAFMRDGYQNERQNQLLD